MLIAVLLLSALLPTPLDAMSSLDFVFPFSFEYILQNLENWLPNVQVRLGTGIQFNGNWWRFKRALSDGRCRDGGKKGNTDIGMHIGSHCAYVGPDRGISLVDLKSISTSFESSKASLPSTNWKSCFEACKATESCSYWNLNYKGVCTLKTIDYPTATGQLSGYCTKGGDRTCSYGGKGIKFVNYSSAVTRTSGDCMDECLKDVEKCTNFNWNQGSCLLYYVSYGSKSVTLYLDAGSCI